MKTKSFEVQLDGVNLKLRRLSRGEIRVCRQLPTAAARAIYITEVACATDLDDLPAGWIFTVADYIREESLLPGDVFTAELELAGNPEWVAENLIATAYPNYDFEAQAEMDTESWERLWARSYWKLVTLMGVDAKSLKKLLNPPPPGTMADDDFQRTVQAMEMMAGVADDRPSQLRTELARRMNDAVHGSAGVDEVHDVRDRAGHHSSDGSVPERPGPGVDYTHPRRAGIRPPAGGGVPG